VTFAQLPPTVHITTTAQSPRAMLGLLYTTNE